jgi:hypothetical protein
MSGDILHSPIRLHGVVLSLKKPHEQLYLYLLKFKTPSLGFHNSGTIYSMGCTEFQFGGEGKGCELKIELTKHFTLQLNNSGCRILTSDTFNIISSYWALFWVSHTYHPHNQWPIIFYRLVSSSFFFFGPLNGHFSRGFLTKILCAFTTPHPSYMQSLSSPLKISRT